MYFLNRMCNRVTFNIFYKYRCFQTEGIVLAIITRRESIENGVLKNLQKTRQHIQTVGGLSLLIKHNFIKPEMQCDSCGSRRTIQLDGRGKDRIYRCSLRNCRDKFSIRKYIGARHSSTS